MTTLDTVDVQRPRTDERRSWNSIVGNIAYPVLLVAHDWSPEKEIKAIVAEAPTNSPTRGI